MTRIETKDANGKYNGWLATLWHVDQGPKIEQVYITAVAPGCMKGPHRHERRRGLFYLISGSGCIVMRDWSGKYWRRDTEHLHGFIVPPGYACALYNTGDVDAIFLNMPSPPWRENEPDDHPVEGWDFKL